jgi:hypothetical protein
LRNVRKIAKQFDAKHNEQGNVQIHPEQIADIEEKEREKDIHHIAKQGGFESKRSVPVLYDTFKKDIEGDDEAHGQKDRKLFADGPVAKGGHCQANGQANDWNNVVNQGFLHSLQT